MGAGARDDGDDVDEVLLRVPARSAYARLVRVGAAALALRQGMSFAEIDDIRLAIDEAMILLLDGHDGDAGVAIDVVYRVTGGLFELEAALSEGADVAAEAVDRFDQLASGLLDDYDVDPERAWVRVRKSHVDEEPA